MKKERVVHKIDYIEGGVYDFIFWGKADDGTPVRFWVSKETLVELARIVLIAGQPGHAVWHRMNPDAALPCPMCAGAGCVGETPSEEAPNDMPDILSYESTGISGDLHRS